MSKKTMDELGEDLCNYCDREESLRGVRNFGDIPVFCFESEGCEVAYENYLLSLEEENYE